MKSPCILHVTVESGEHFITYFGFSRGKYLISDPNKNVRLYTQTELNEIWVSGICLSVEKTDLFEKNSLKRNRLKSIIQLAKPDSIFLLWTVLLGIVVSIFGLSTSIFLQQLIDNYLIEANSIDDIYLSVLLLGLILCVSTILGYSRGITILSQSKRFNNRVVKQFFHKLMYLPKTFFDQKSTGDFVARMNDTSKIQQGITHFTNVILIQFLIALSGFALSAFYSREITLLILGLVPIQICIMLVFNRSIYLTKKRVMESRANNESIYIDSITGIDSIIVQNWQEQFLARVSTVYNRFQEDIKQAGNIGFKYEMYIRLSHAISLVSIIFLSFSLIQQGELMVGEMVAIITVTGRIFPAVETIIKANLQFKDSVIAFERLTEFADIAPEFTAKESDSVVNSISKIEFRKLSFGYQTGIKILQEVNLSLHKGKWVTLLGEAGSGKTTLLHLLNKYYEPSLGHITLDGIDLNTINHKIWRKSVGYVPQDIKIFNLTFIENISINTEIESVKKINNLLKRMKLEHLFMNLPFGFKTILGDGGISLSGGQKQVLGLIRALHHDPEWLFLDEATSAMDIETERKVLDFLASVKGQVGIFFITHKTSMVSRSDYVYELKNKSTSKLD